VAELCDVVSEVAGIDGADHFAQHPGWLSVEFDLGVKACGGS
jgi:hypothetical protein